MSHGIQTLHHIVIVHNNTVCHTEWVTIKTLYANVAGLLTLA